MRTIETIEIPDALVPDVRLLTLTGIHDTATCISSGEASCGPFNIMIEAVDRLALLAAVGIQDGSPDSHEALVIPRYLLSVLARVADDELEMTEAATREIDAGADYTSEFQKWNRARRVVARRVLDFVREADLPATLAS